MIEQSSIALPKVHDHLCGKVLNGDGEDLWSPPRSVAYSSKEGEKVFGEVAILSLRATLSSS